MIDKATSQIRCTCPYCGKEQTLKPPLGLESKSFPIEIVSVPYTRDVGRFDSKKDWSRIGTDFASYLRYDRIIGILRISRPGIDVRYKVAVCSKCSSLFDIYANYTKGKKALLADFWPHLFEFNDQVADDFKSYHGQSWTVWLIRRLGKLLHQDDLAAVLLALLIGLLSFIPWMLPGHTSWISNSINIELVVSLILRGIAVIGIAVILLLINRYVYFWDKEDGFYSLFDVKSRRGITHWKNFSLSRIVGVQTRRFPSITQVDLFGGILAVLSLLVIWLCYRQPIISKWEMLNAIFDLGFWVIVIFLFGSAVWLAMNSSLYTLEGAKRIPLRLEPLTGFPEIKPLHRIAFFSSAIMFSSLILILFIVAALVAGSQQMVPIEVQLAIKQMNWLLEWSRYGLFGIFVIFGLTIAFHSRWFIIIIPGIYLILTLSLSQSNVSISLGSFSFVINYPVALFGLFLAALLYFYYKNSFGIISRILLKYKARALAEIEQQIANVRNNLLNSDSLQEEYLYLNNLLNLLNLHDRLQKIPVGRGFRNSYAIITQSSVFISLLLPKLIDVALKYL